MVRGYFFGNGNEYRKNIHKYRDTLSGSNIVLGISKKCVIIERDVFSLSL